MDDQAHDQKPMRNWHKHWNEAPLRVGPTDFLAQVEKTINGQAVDSGQVDLVVRSICESLAMDSRSVVLDLCCGNGLISALVARHCAILIGVDYSSTLIDIATRFHSAANVMYVCRSVADLAASDLGGRRPDSVYMNTALQYFDESDLAHLLRSLTALSGKACPLYIADIPDVARLHNFYNTPERQAEYARRVAEGTEAIGRWWSRDDIRDVAAGFGYSCRFVEQDPRQYGAHYRFDVLFSLSKT